MYGVLDTYLVVILGIGYGIEMTQAKMIIIIFLGRVGGDTGAHFQPHYYIFFCNLSLPLTACTPSSTILRAPLTGPSYI